MTSSAPANRWIAACGIDRVACNAGSYNGIGTTVGARIAGDSTKKSPVLTGLFYLALTSVAYIMPPMPPMPPISGIDGASSFGFSATIASVVSSRPDTEAAFCSA